MSIIHGKENFLKKEVYNILVKILNIQVYNKHYNNRKDVVIGDTIYVEEEVIKDYFKEILEHIIVFFEHPENEDCNGNK